MYCERNIADDGKCYTTTNYSPCVQTFQIIFHCLKTVDKIHHDFIPVYYYSHEQ